ncbi:MAG: DUF1460 domain-containing protein [Bacteroidales bacterium]|nr:DUF1460 domain-containing protein [Bacteroidales bacterium]
MMKKNAILLILTLFSGSLFAQFSADMSRDRQIVQNYFAQIKAADKLDFNDLLINTARFFLNTPYVGHTLEVGDEERLIINLRELDCMTFMETCVALSRVVAAGTPDFDSYCRQLQGIRYRGGVIDGYTSRLHYTSDWMADNIDTGIVEDVTRLAGGKPLHLKLSFMSSRSDAYRHLKGYPDRVAFMRQVEERVNTRGGYYYIPKQEIKRHQEHIKSGDIIGFTTSTEGMDISHIGIAYWQNGELGFIHASSTEKKVVVDAQSLSDYCAGIRTNTGIIVLRCIPVVPVGL